MIAQTESQNPQDLYLNIKWTLKLIEEQSSKKELLVNQNQVQIFKQDILETYISFAEIQKDPFSPITAQLKIIGIFLLKIFNAPNIQFPKELKIRFLHTFTDFIANKNKGSLSEWDVIDFQKDYWKVLQSTSSTKTVVLEKSFQFKKTFCAEITLNRRRNTSGSFGKYDVSPKRNERDFGFDCQGDKTRDFS